MINTQLYKFKEIYFDKLLASQLTFYTRGTTVTQSEAKKQ